MCSCEGQLVPNCVHCCTSIIYVTLGRTVLLGRAATKADTHTKFEIYCPPRRAPHKRSENTQTWLGTDSGELVLRIVHASAFDFGQKLDEFGQHWPNLSQSGPILTSVVQHWPEFVRIWRPIYGNISNKYSGEYFLRIAAKSDQDLTKVGQHWSNFGQLGQTCPSVCHS